MVKLKIMENVQESVMLVFIIKTQLVSSEDAPMDSRTTDSEVVSAQLFQQEDANHQLSN